MPRFAIWEFLGRSFWPREFLWGKMRQVRITKRFVDGLETTEAEYFAWDAELKGFGVRVQASGAKSYVFKYSYGTGRGAPTRRMTLARVGSVTPEEAHGLAKREAGKVAHGADPASAKADERKAETVSELAAVFLAQHVEAKRKASTVEQYRQPRSASRRPWPRRYGCRCDRTRGATGPRQGARSGRSCSPGCARAASQ
jgi:Arm DNA-binding domain